MKIRADFQISHGDIFQCYGMEVKTDAFGNDSQQGRAVSAKYGAMTLNWHIENMAAHIITGLFNSMDQGWISESAHLVTHPEDYPL